MNNNINSEEIRTAVEEISAGICSDVNAPASHLPEKVVDWITETFISDYLEKGENRLPEVNDVLKGICDYLQEECSSDADNLREKKRKIDEIKTSLENMGYSLSGFSDSDLEEIYDKTYDLIAEDDIYKDSLNVALNFILKRTEKTPL